MTAMTFGPVPGDPLGIEGQLDAVDQRARSIACGLTEAQGSWRAAPAEASVTDCLAHHLEWLRRTVPILRTAVHGVRSTWRARLGEVRSGWWWQIAPRVAEYMPMLWHSRGEEPGALPRRPVRQLMVEVLALHAEVRCLARESEVRDLRTAYVRLPYLSALRCPIDVALAIVPAMARRHLRTAERVRLEAGFPRV